MTQAHVLETFGKYHLLRKIGQGGMAEVFLAQADDAPQGAAPVVIKRLHQTLEKDRDAVDLFLTEADVTMMLDHPNIIRVYDSGEVGNRYYMAMEYVAGKDLEQIFERYQSKERRMDVNVAVHVMCEVLRGLDYVHQARTASGRPLGIVHRDVTPSNIYISNTGHVKLGDFGVAKLMGMEKWTMSGSIKGKLGYLSPEQVGGQAPTQSIDLWAAAVILFELVSGQRVFTGENELDVMLRIRDAKVPELRKVDKEAPKTLSKILERALHKKEKKRYATAGELLQDLLAFQQREGQPVAPDALVKYLVSTLA
ncbi:MAG TPA: serine/threonine-protein kinase [Myxococcota bacterium]|nr:serine/threonine-protein kinase [Myxococcota bacterium]